MSNLCVSEKYAHIFLKRVGCPKEKSKKKKTAYIKNKHAKSVF